MKCDPWTNEIQRSTNNIYKYIDRITLFLYNILLLVLVDLNDVL